MDVRLGTCNVSSLQREVSLKAVAEGISQYKLVLVGVQKVRCERGGTEPASEYTFFYGTRNDNHEVGTGFPYIRESYQQLTG
jgi:hypothetical protein